MRATVVVLLLVTGCALAARDHACYPYVQREFKGQVPPDVMHWMAHEHRTRKEVDHYRAPVGYYLRRRGSRASEMDRIGKTIGDYEVARCPSPAAPLEAKSPLPLQH